jgi:DNA-binding beta-propeller fold protein YncE
MLGMKRLLVLAALLAASGCGSGGSAGSVDHSWGGPGKEAGRFVKPRGLAADAARNAVYVVDMSGRLQKFDLEGHFLASVLLPDSRLGTGEGLAVTAGGQLLVADTHYHRVLRYSPELDLLGSFGQRGDAPGKLLFPTCVALDEAGNIYVAGYGDNRVQKFDARGEYLGGWGRLGKEPGEFQRPSGLAVDLEGRVVVVADAANHRIQRFTPEGRLVSCWGSMGTGPGGLHYPYDVALLPDGTLAVADNYNNRVQRFTVDGEYLGHFGGPGRELGEFARPWCLAPVPDGRVYVADTLNHRVQVVRLRGVRPAKSLAAAPGAPGD